MRIKNHTEVYEEVSKELNIPVETVYKTYRAFWKFIRSSIESLPIKEDTTEEEFNKLKTNFNISSLGKLNCTFDRMMNMKKRLEYIKKLRNGIKD